MAFQATYVDASTFTVGSDRTDEFVQGRRILADCGDDGEKTSHVTSSSYDSGADETTVNIYHSILTSNLSDVWYGAISPGADGSLPIHDHSTEEQGGQLDIGNGLPVQSFGEVSSDIQLDLQQYRTFEVEPTASITIDIINLFADKRGVAYLMIKDPANYNLNFTCEGGDGEVRNLDTSLFRAPTSGWMVETASYIGNFEVDYEEGLPYGHAWKPDGTVLLLSWDSDGVGQLELGTAWDITTATLTKKNSTPGRIKGLDINDDGTKIVVTDRSEDTCKTYELSTPYDIGSVSEIASFSTSHTSNCRFAKNGEKLFVTGYSECVMYNLSTPYDITTRDSGKVVFSGYVDSANSIYFSSDGYYFYTICDNNPVRQYELERPWDLTNATFIAEGPTPGEPGNAGLSFKGDGTKLYIAWLYYDGSRHVYIEEYGVTGKSRWDIVAFHQEGTNIIHGMTLTAPYIPEAPSDDTPYARQNKFWSALPVQEAPDDGIQYARKNKSWDQVQAMQEHDNTWHSKDFMTAAAVRDEAASVHFALMAPADAFREGDIVSFTTEPTFKEGSTESFTTTTSS